MASQIHQQTVDETYRRKHKNLRARAILPTLMSSIKREKLNYESSEHIFLYARQAHANENADHSGNLWR